MLLVENLTIVNLDYTYPTSLRRRVVSDDRGHSDKVQVYGVCGTRQCLLSTSFNGPDLNYLICPRKIALPG